MATPLSPSSSPRLPSPPPMAEDQVGPISPGGLSTEEQVKAAGGSVDHGASRRIRPGTRAADMAEGPPLVDLKDIDSAFQLTEHLKALHNSLIHPEDKNHSVPVDRSIAVRLAQPPDGVDRNLWLYELCRFLSEKANNIIIALFADDPPCSAQTCPEMRASEWQYLCAVHDPPKSCCAIDYCCHTLDWASNILTSPKHFPSRLALGTEMNSQNSQVRLLSNILRRVYRIFAHAWFQHREIFWKVETRTGLYVFFKTVCDVYGLLDKDSFTIPREAEGLEPEPQEKEKEVIKEDERRESIVQHSTGPPTAVNVTTATGNTTKRHRQTPSLSQAPVTTVVEEAEDEDEKTESSDKEKSAQPESTPAKEESKVEEEKDPDDSDEDEVEEADQSSKPKATEPEKVEEKDPDDSDDDDDDDAEPVAEPKSKAAEKEDPDDDDDDEEEDEESPTKSLSEDVAKPDADAKDEDEASKTVAD